MNKLYISLLFISCSLQLSTHAADSIISSQIIRDDHDDTIISSHGTFELGFFSPENSSNRYVGIWYTTTTPRTVVWVANRDDPLTDRSGALRVARPGVLLILNATNATIWSTNISSAQSPVTVVTAQLLDSGNLVVTDANPENLLWQSFDYPTDTFLPGMKLGKNFMTGHEVYITSWKNRGDPATGAFTFSFDTTGYPQIITKNGANITYRMGLPDMRKSTLNTIGVVINKEEAYYHYEAPDNSTNSRFTLDENGLGRRFVWVDRTQEWIGSDALPRDSCDSYNVCSKHGVCSTETETPHPCECLNKFKPNDVEAWGVGGWSSGCSRSTPLDCRTDGFLKYSGVKLPDTRITWFDETVRALKECEVLCMRNCSCTAYARPNISEGAKGCLLWFGDLIDIRRISPGQDFYIRIASSDLGSQGRKREILLIVTVCVVAGMLVVISLTLLLYSRRRRLRSNYVDFHPDHDLELPMFDISTIIKATHSFSMNNKLGEGGFGPVYKGLLEDGQIIAVKRLSKTSLQGVDEFKNEIICIAKLQHRNLVKLLGCCIQGEELMLVYEYMTNKSLDLILFDPTKSMVLDWPRRFNIINGIARGLMYLHQDSRLRVIHRDLKTSNILLDTDMNP